MKFFLCEVKVTSLGATSMKGVGCIFREVSQFEVSQKTSASSKDWVNWEVTESCLTLWMTAEVITVLIVGELQYHAASFQYPSCPIVCKQFAGKIRKAYFPRIFFYLYRSWIKKKQFSCEH